MDEYIKREATIERLKKNLYASNPGSFSYLCYQDAINSVQEIPPADVVPVVHCKDCVYSRPAGKKFEDMVVCTNLSKECLYMMKSDFCGSGIFKEAANGSSTD